MEAIRDPSVNEIVVMKAAQVGWTEILNNVIGYHIHQEPAPILLLQPTLEMAEAWSKDRFAPMARDTPVLAERIADPKSRDSGNTLLHKRFRGGQLSIVGANSPSGLASRPIRIVLCDEVDRFPVSAGSEGDPIDLARRRTSTFRNRKILMGSTPTIKGASRIEAAFEESDQRFYFVPCPHCDEYQRLVWQQVQWPDGEPERASYVCQHCGALIAEHHKLEMFLRGEWRATKQSRGIAGFHLPGMYSLWVPWRQMAQEFLRAKRLPETLQTWINTALGESWEDSGEAAKPEGLLARRESYTAANLPSGVLLLTRGTDVQDDRLESTLWGWGRDGEAWRIEHDVLRGDPGQQSLWAEHDELLRRRYTTDDGRELVCEATAVDSGGHHTQSVYAYCGTRKHKRVWAIKGVSGAKPAWPKRASRGRRLRVDVWPIGVDTIKDVVLARLGKVTEPGPGYLHLDATTDQTAVEQLTAETKIYVTVLGRKVRAWRPRRAGLRNEQGDCLVYAYAAMIGRGGNDLVGRRNSGPVVQQESAPPVLAPVPGDPGANTPRAMPPAPVPRRPPRRGGWMNSWR